MLYTHDTTEALASAAWLVNSVLPPATLVSVDDLSDFLETFGYSGRHDATEAELDGVRAVLPRVRALLVAERDEAVDMVNTILRQARAVPQLVRHDKLDWHIHAVDDDSPLSSRILVETAMAMIDLIRADDLSRLTLCADADCGGVVVDLSRNRSRKYCSTTCGNRNAVAAYRARQAEGSD